MEKKPQGMRLFYILRLEYEAQKSTRAKTEGRKHKRTVFTY